MADIRLLADVPEVIPAVAAWYRAEWSDWFAETTLEAIEADLSGTASRTKLPLGLVAYDPAGHAAGFCSLRDDSFEPYPHAGPWLRGLYVHGPWREQGLAGELIRAAEQQARRMGIKTLYAATGAAIGLFEHVGWLGFDEVRHEQQILTIFARRIA